MPIKRINLEMKKLRAKLKEKENFLKEQKNLTKKAVQTTKQIAKNLRSETQQHAVTAIIAAFGFIIALVWKDAIKEYVNIFVTKFSVSGPSALITFYTAMITTIIAVIGIVIITRWGSKSHKA